MEQFLLERLHLHLSSTSDSSCRIRALSTARSLITNPSSAASTVSSAVETLIVSLSHFSDDASFLRLAISLLAEAATIHRCFAVSVISAVRPFLDGRDHLAADAVAALASIAGSSAEEGFSLVESIFDENLVISLATSPIFAVRSRILGLLVYSIGRAKTSAILGHKSLLQVFLGIAIDLYPSVRRSALDGLVALCKEAGVDVNSLAVECCYDRAVEALKDEDELVRSAAVRLASLCAEMFAAREKAMDYSEQIDMIFVQLCSVARDMSVKVRVEAFNALGKVQNVSESVLLQSLSKKVQGIKSGNITLGKLDKESKFRFSCAAGIFIHGIEDEFFEVRTIACRSLGMLTKFSVQFADDALNLLMDMLNDDAEVVRLQVLQTLFDMATYDRLQVQEKHMHMFLGLLGDFNASIRSSARKTLRLMKLPKLEIFKSAIDGLIGNLETYPEEEEDIFFVLFSLGVDHRKFSVKLAKDLAKQIGPSCDGELTLDSHKVAAVLVLSISLPFAGENFACDIPPVIFSYAIPLLGRIAFALQGVIDQDSVLAHLCRNSGMPFLDKTLGSKEAGQICSSSLPVWSIASKVSNKETVSHMSEILKHPEQSRQEDEYLNEEFMRPMELILETVGETWPLTKSYSTYEVRRTLRTCQEELEMIAWNAPGLVSASVDFVSQYIQVVQLIAEAWEKMQPKSSHDVGSMTLDILVEKLEMSLRRMRHGFPGLPCQMEYHVLELTLLANLLKVSKAGFFSDLGLMKIRVIISRLESLCAEGSYKLSDFAQELKGAIAPRAKADVPHQINVYNFLKLFNPQQIRLVGKFKNIKAEVQALDNDSENPLIYVSGLPVGIRFRITLYNISDQDRLWLCMVVGEVIQYVFLDLCQFEGSNEMRCGTVVLPFFATPMASSFVLRVCLGIECPSENVAFQKKIQGRPKDDIALLCEEFNVYFVRIGDR
ncbi:protein SIEL isoform X1 [Typha latifolia]|uniref:protein SIEL isoform X1 n=1 Tax=Typha latifolia TaxID=4733 RepID=UPI003C30B680